jgi:hypothetical protein
MTVTTFLSLDMGQTFPETFLWGSILPFLVFEIAPNAEISSHIGQEELLLRRLQSGQTLSETGFML